jgi:hypothetical protein
MEEELEDGLEEIPVPIGKFIIENAKNGRVGNDGVYYHYAEVCKLLRLYHKTELEKLEKTKNK